MLIFHNSSFGKDSTALNWLEMAGSGIVSAIFALGSRTLDTTPFVVKTLILAPKLLAPNHFLTCVYIKECEFMFHILTHAVFLAPKRFLMKIHVLPGRGDGPAQSLLPRRFPEK